MKVPFQFFLPALSLTVLSFTPALSQALEIQARVVDSTNLEPVAFTTVYLNEYTGTITDELGFFRLRLSAGNYADTLHISCIGYAGTDIPVKDLKLAGLDSIYLRPSVVKLNEVNIQTRAKRTPGSKEILKHAIENITSNYPDTSMLYKGYYREYIKQGDEYINLFETIMNLSESGFQDTGEFDAGLLYKRINPDFRVDNSLMRPYDNRDKFVPFSTMQIPLNNELVILRAQDPIRNHSRKSLYFIYCLEKDFIKNHNFNPPRLTYLEDRPYYSISFRDNRKFFNGHSRITAEGTIFIDALNYGIARLNYRGNLLSGTSRRKLFELSLEYRWNGEAYVLHYQSFNNLFYTRNFAVTGISLDHDMLALSFNRSPDPESALQTGNLSVFLGDKQQEIKKAVLMHNRMLISFAHGSDLAEKLKINLLPESIQNRNRILENMEYITANVKLKFGDFRDMQGNGIADREFNEYYQYREFFTKQVSSGRQGITSNLVNKLVPVIDSRIYGEYRGDTSWMNTPLIRERVAAKTVLRGNRQMNRYIETLSANEEYRLNESVYIQTDREMYAPADTLWFKAYIRNEKYLTPSALSRTFDVLLVNEHGEVLVREKYLAGETGAHGQIFLENNLEEGIYYIMGYSSWMKNFGDEALFCKRILVTGDQLNGFRLAAAFDRPEYFPGDTVSMLVNCYDAFKREVGDVNFSYSFVAGGKVIRSGKANTGRSWLEPILLVVPGGLEQNPAVEFRASYKSQGLDTVFTLPVSHDVQVDFFPEGGSCINGTDCEVAFKAVTSNGNPVEIEGEVLDREGRLVERITSIHDGMGKFSYRPRADRECFLRLTNPAINGREYPLPRGMDSGWLLHVSGDGNFGEELEVEISNINSSNDSVLLTLMVRGYLCHYELIRTGRKHTARIPIADLPRGLGVLTLFDHRMLPCAERLVYLPPSGNVRADLNTDRPRYVPRDSVHLTLYLEGDRPGPDGGSWSLAVMDNQLCTTDVLDEPDIRTSLLMSSEIRGSIHHLNDYLDDRNENAPRNMDLLVMTQGWRRYRYREEQQVLPISRPVNMDVVSGNLVKQPLASGSRPVEGVLSVTYGGNTSRIPVGKDGEFSFLPDYSMQTNSGIFLYAEDRNGKSNLSIVLNSTAFEDHLAAYLRVLVDSLGREPLRSIFDRERIQDHFSLGLENHQWLEEVVISKKAVREDMELADIALDKRTATPDELKSAVRMEDLERRVRKPNMENYPIYYVVDGILQFQYIQEDRNAPVRIPDYSLAHYILPENIREFTVITGPEVEALYGYGIRYVIDVRTNGMDINQPRRPYDNPVAIGKLAVSKEFYSPVYDNGQKKRNPIPDLRKTILWKPDLNFDENGTAEVVFYNGDRYTRIRCVLEGITGNGIPVHAEHFYDITLTRE